MVNKMAGDEPDPERGSQPPEKAPVAASSTVGENTVTTVDKVILLSFRGLQLRRIEELQDSLLSWQAMPKRNALLSNRPEWR